MNANIFHMYLNTNTITLQFSLSYSYTQVQPQAVVTNIPLIERQRLRGVTPLFCP